jgi:hypothetical protein
MCMRVCVCHEVLCLHACTSLCFSTSPRQAFRHEGITHWKRDNYDPPSIFDEALSPFPAQCHTFVDDETKEEAKLCWQAAGY